MWPLDLGLGTFPPSFGLPRRQQCVSHFRFHSLCGGPLLNFFPALGVGDPRDCRADIAVSPSFGPPFFLSSLCALSPPSPQPDGDSNLPALTSANASPTSPPLTMEELDDHPNAPTETPCSNTTQPSQLGMVNTRPVCGDDILAAVCHAPTNGPGSPTAQLQHVESLLCDEWERPLDVIIPSSGSQQYRLEARHLRDVYSECYVADSAEIVVYYWWLTRTALSADRDVMGVAWVVRDSLCNASCVICAVGS